MAAFGREFDGLAWPQSGSKAARDGLKSRMEGEWRPWARIRGSCATFGEQNSGKTLENLAILSSNFITFVQM